MKRTILRVDGTQEVAEVGNGYKSWNEAIGAGIGEIVVSPDRTLELWCDEEGLCRAEPQINRAATLLAMRQIVGDVIVFRRGDIK